MQGNFHLDAGYAMAHCPYCSNVMYKNEFICRACGAESGYVYVNKKARGMAFIIVYGLVIPVIIAIFSPLYFLDSEIIFW